MNDIKHGIRPIDANALLDAMPKSTVLLRHQVVAEIPKIRLMSQAISVGSVERE